MFIPPPTFFDPEPAPTATLAGGVGPDAEPNPASNPFTTSSADPKSGADGAVMSDEWLADMRLVKVRAPSQSGPRRTRSLLLASDGRNTKVFNHANGRLLVCCRYTNS